MGIKIVSASGAEVVATMPVAGNIQPFGLLHGGASCVLAETIGSLGAALHAGLGRVVVGIEISATHHRAARDGEVTAVATLAHGGRTLATYDIVITDSAGRRVCTSRLTCLIRDQVAGTATATAPIRCRWANREQPGAELSAGRFCAARRRVANVVTAGPGVQVDNVSAGEGGHGTNGSPGSRFSQVRSLCRLRSVARSRCAIGQPL